MRKYSEPTVEAAPSDNTPVKVAEAISASSEANLSAIRLLSTLETKMSNNDTDNKLALTTLIDSLRPKQKIIDVQVTKFNADGRPTNYRITVTQ